VTSRKKSLHHEATADASEALALAADVGVKNHGLLETESLATPVLNAKNALLERNVPRVKNVHPVKNGRRVKNELSVLLVNQWQPNVLHAALLHGIAVKAPKIPVTAVTHEHLELLRSLQISRPGKKQSVPCR
jgi:hypothetical protein